MNEIYRQYLIEGERVGMRYSLLAPRKVPLDTTGIHMSNRSGSSLEFKDHREYQPGDDLRYIDWNAYARTDKLIVKLYHEEVSPHLDIIIDGSRSMALENSAKAQATLALAALFAEAASNADHTHCAWIARQGCQKVVNGYERPSVWEGIDFEYCGSFLESLAQSISDAPARPVWRLKGIRVLLSDLLWLGDPQMALWHLAQGAAAVIIVQILAVADTDPPEFGNIRLVDSETGEVQEIFMDSSAIKRYQDALARHQQNWHLACRQAGTIMTTVIAEKILGDWHLVELVAAEVLQVVRSP